MRKITIEPTTGADTRSATEIVAKGVLLRESHLHRSHVRLVMAALAADLIERGERHDHTKIDLIDDFHDNFVQAMRKTMPFKDHPWWRAHLTEKHHINDHMHEDADLLDLVEMVADCVCAGKARTGSVFPVEVPAEKLQRLLQNTVTKLIAAVEVAQPPSSLQPEAAAGDGLTTEQRIDLEIAKATPEPVPPRTKPCPECNGRGWQPGDCHPRETCGLCGGSGEAAPCGGSRCWRTDDGKWVHSSKSYGSCSVNAKEAGRAP